MKSARRQLAVALTLLWLFPAPVTAQCDWTGRLLRAASRYNGDYSSCVALGLPPLEFARAWEDVEKHLMSQLKLGNDPEQQVFLQNTLDQYLKVAGASAIPQKVFVVEDPQPNAFASGQKVFFTRGIFQWYLNPRESLRGWGFSAARIQNLLGPVEQYNPGKTGLQAILAHEAAHNLLGHPTRFPLASWCNRYVDTGTRSIDQYQRQISTGEKPSDWKETAKELLVGYGETFLENQEQQLRESDADSLGAWLAWKVTGDPHAMTRTLRWLARIPGSLPSGRKQAFFEALCSDHPNLMARVAAARRIGDRLRKDGFFDRSGFQTPDVGTAMERYGQFVKWANWQVQAIHRIASGRLTSAEARIQKAVRVETNPARARLWVDGRQVGQSPMNLRLSLGPHQIRAELGGRIVERKVVIFEEVPETVKLEFNE